MRPFFSVVIPVYNRAHSLGAALRSVLAQTEQDFEIVAVDDGSKDNPENIVALHPDPRIRIVRQENHGGGAARNAGIDLAQGRFIAFLDSDDSFLPHHLAAMRRLLSGTESVVGYASLIADRGAGRSFVKPPRALGADEHMADYLLCDRGFVPTITLVVPQAFAKSIRYDEDLPFAQDTDFAIRLFLGGCRFVMASEPGAVWHDESDAKRISAGRKGAQLQGWLEALRPRIPVRSYHGARGWMIAKGVAQTNPFAALKLYLGAVLRGCYRARLAAVIFLQIFAPEALYRKWADWVIAICRGDVWSKDDRAVRPALR